MLRNLWLRWKYRGEDLTGLKTLLDLSIKAGRRCNHDLKHCVSDLAVAVALLKDHGIERSWVGVDIYRSRQEMWHEVFYPLNGVKDYRAQMWHEQFKLEQEISRLKALCKKHNIDPEDPQGIPF